MSTSFPSLNDTSLPPPPAFNSLSTLKQALLPARLRLSNCCSHGQAVGRAQGRDRQPVQKRHLRRREGYYADTRLRCLVSRISPQRYTQFLTVGSIRSYRQYFKKWGLKKYNRKDGNGRMLATPSPTASSAASSPSPRRATPDDNESARRHVDTLAPIRDLSHYPPGQQVLPQDYAFNK